MPPSQGSQVSSSNDGSTFEYLSSSPPVAPLSPKIHKTGIVYDAIVIGTGFAGGSTAVTLAEDKSKKILALNLGTGVADQESTSAHQGFRVHTGLHYSDLETALQCLDDSLKLATLYPDILCGDSPDDNGRHGIYVFVSNSLVSPDVMRAHAGKIAEHYAKYCKETKTTPFGSPDKFMQELALADLKHVAKKIPYRVKDGKIESYIKPELAIQVQEPIVDLARARAHFEKAFKDNADNLTFKPRHKVTKISYSQDSLDYVVEAQDLEGTLDPITHLPPTYSFRTKALFCCAWQKNEELLRGLGLYSPLQNVYIRPKVSLKIKYDGNMPTTSFGVGPHACFTNSGDGTAMMTHEWTTNLTPFPAGGFSMPEDIKALTKIILVPDSGPGKKLADEIILGCKGYMEELGGVEVLEVSISYVKMPPSAQPPDLALDNKNSAIHGRVCDGLREATEGVFEFSGMKMVKALTRSDEVGAMSDRYLSLYPQLSSHMAKIRDVLKKNHVEERIANVLVYSTFREDLIISLIDLIGKLYENVGKPKELVTIKNDFYTNILRNLLEFANQHQTLFVNKTAEQNPLRKAEKAPTPQTEPDPASSLEKSKQDYVLRKQFGAQRSFPAPPPALHSTATSHSPS